MNAYWASRILAPLLDTATTTTTTTMMMMKSPHQIAIQTHRRQSYRRLLLLPRYALSLLILLTLYAPLRLLIGIGMFKWTGFATPLWFFHESFYERARGVWWVLVMMEVVRDGVSNGTLLDEEMGGEWEGSMVEGDGGGAVAAAGDDGVVSTKWMWPILFANWVWTTSSRSSSHGEHHDGAGFMWTMFASLASGSLFAFGQMMYRVIIQPSHRRSVSTGLPMHHRLADEMEFKYRRRKQTVRRTSGSEPSSSSTTVAAVTRGGSVVFLRWARRQLSLALILFLLAIAANSFLEQTTPLPMETFKHSVQRQVPHRPVLLSVVIMTAPRASNPRYLIETIKSFDQVWPVDPGRDAMFNRFEVVVFTSSREGTHAVFDDAERLFQRVHFTRRTDHVDTDPVLALHQQVQNGHNQTPYMAKLIKIRKQRLDFAAGLEYALNKSHPDPGPGFVMIAEDDMPLCPEAWPTLHALLAHSFDPTQSTQSRQACGIFIGTGGSGLIFHHQIAHQAIRVLRSPLFPNRPADILLQQCLRGHLPECSTCSHPRRKLLVPARLMMRHIGFAVSSFGDRTYGSDAFQCGWRHPFNGLEGVGVLNSRLDRVDGI